ncbi:MAG: ferrous iron transporter B [Clostridia bacterium]|nr:ferrous iron transporter B [Clostridia bacterium]
MRKIVFVGRPNSGKSTLLNSLTGEDFKVGNWHGVTVREKERTFWSGGEKLIAVDLPGIYSLSSYRAEEKVTVDYLRSQNYDGIVLVAEAAKLNFALDLYEELTALNRPIALFINFYNELTRLGGKIDIQKLSARIGAEVFFGEACKKKDAEKLNSFFDQKKAVVGKVRAVDKREDLFFIPRDRSRSGFFLKAGFCYLVFALSSLVVFWSAFGKYGVGEGLSSLIERFIDFLCQKTQMFTDKNFTPFLSGLIVTGLRSVGTVASFLPQVAVMSLGLDILDQSGFISTLAVVTDGALTRLGLNGKAAYSLLGGFGCTTVALALASGIDDAPVRRRTALCLPFMTCSAKTPVYALICKITFGKYAPFVIVGIYLFSFVFSLAFALVSYKADGRAPSPLVVEIAKLRIPKAKVLFANLKRVLKNFGLRITTTVVISSVVLYLLGSLSTSFTLTTPSDENSILALLGRSVVVVFRPMGIDDWRYAVSAIVGVFAKEGIVSSLTSLFPSGLTLPFSSALPYLAFIYAYPPCVSALSASFKLLGKKEGAYLAVVQLLFAFLFAYAVRFFILIVAKTAGVMI